MKAILLYNDIHLDGMGSVAVTLLRALKAQGMPCVALHAYDEIDLPGYREEFHPLFVPGTMGYATDCATIQKLVAKLDEVAVDGDVVMTNGQPNWLACLPYIKPGIRWVTGVHSINPSTLKICRAYPERVSAFVCISEGVRQRFLKKLPKQFHHKVHLIPNAVDVCCNPKTDYRLIDELNNATLQPSVTTVSRPTIRILFVGRIEDTSKGCGKLPHILAELRKRNVPVQLDLYGYFHNWENQWWHAVDKAGVRDMVKYCGKFDHAKIYELIVKYDVFISPSNFEGFPLSQSEAMMAGMPIVVSNISGVTDWICEYGKCGALVKKTDIVGFAAALEKIYRNADYRELIGRNAKRRIRSLASFDAHGRHYEELFKKCSAEHSYGMVSAHPIDQFVMPEGLKPWGPARLLPIWAKTFLRKYMK